MSSRNSFTTDSGWWERIEEWLKQPTRRYTKNAPDSVQPMTDDEVIARWQPVTQIRPGFFRFNPLLDLPLKPYANMDKTRLWEMFVYRLGESEAQNILQAEEAWANSRECDIINSVTSAILFDDEPHSMPEGQLAPWHCSQEAPLRPSDLAAAVIVWLWRNGLRHEAVSVFVQIWRAVRSRQELSLQPCIPWPADSALEGFRTAAYRDWDDHDQAEFTILFRERYVLHEIEQGIEDLIN